MTQPINTARRLDPVISLAMALHAGPRTFAVLVGSGVSARAGVPTGWAVVTELLRRRAVLEEGSAEIDDPISWYRSRYSDDPEYSHVLEELAPSPGERRNLLESFFIPNDDDRAAGRKVPTRGHRAIAQLVAKGYVNLLVTTNFDRLLEHAVAEAGIDPVVIATEESAQGAKPFAHSSCTILKVHGDYLDPSIRNTVAELGTYGPAMDHRLDQVVDEYGIVVCGWSAEWDRGLRATFERATSRRYGTYWTHLSALGEHAQRLVPLRSAATIPIAGADEFFEELLSKVCALEELARPPAPTVALVAAEVKRYVPDHASRIRLRDLIQREVRAALAAMSFPAGSPEPSNATITERMHLYESASAKLVTIASVLAFYGEDPEHVEYVAEIARRLASPPVPRAGVNHNVWTEMQGYPALLVVYAVTLASLAAQRSGPLVQLLKTEVRDTLRGGTQRLMRAVNLGANLGTAASAIGAPRQKTPVSDYLFGHPEEAMSELVGSKEEYEQLFDQAEYLLGVIITAMGTRGPFGRFVWRSYSGFPTDGLARFSGALIAAGVFQNAEEVTETKRVYEEGLTRSGLRL